MLKVASLKMMLRSASSVSCTLLGVCTLMEAFVTLMSPFCVPPPCVETTTLLPLLNAVWSVLALTVALLALAVKVTGS